MNKRPTIQTVAERAGVSRGTVDRVLNNRSYVRADVRERVLSAIRETGYLSPREAHRQAAAEQPSLPRVKVGIVLPNWGGPFREEVTRGIEAASRALAERNAEIRVRICGKAISVETIELLDGLLSWGAQGIALCALNDIMIEARVNELAEQGIPCITFNSDSARKPRHCFVGQDYAKAAVLPPSCSANASRRTARSLRWSAIWNTTGTAPVWTVFARMHECGFETNQIEVSKPTMITAVPIIR